LPASSPIAGNLLRIRGDRADLPRLPCTASVSVEFVHDDSSHGRSSPRRARRCPRRRPGTSLHVQAERARPPSTSAPSQRRPHQSSPPSSSTPCMSPSTEFRPRRPYIIPPACSSTSV
jgi:hypothetical protein